MEKLLKYETFNKNVWECCCGQGHLSKVLEDYGYDVKSTDLIDRGYGIGDTDFLKTNEKFDGDIITNPPYRLAKEFVIKALDTITDGHKVCFLLRIQFLEGVNRYTNLFSKYPPKYIYIYLLRELTVQEMVNLTNIQEVLYALYGLYGKKVIKENRQ